MPFPESFHEKAQQKIDDKKSKPKEAVHMRDFDSSYKELETKSPEEYAAKKSAFEGIMQALRDGNEDKAIKLLDAHPDLINIGENKLDFESVGRFTTPFLLSATHGRNKFLKELISRHADKVDLLTQSHCGQQVLAHAVVKSHETPEKKLQQASFAEDLIKFAQDNLSAGEYKQFLLGGGVWGRTALYNALFESQNSQVATHILKAVRDVGLMSELRDSRLQLKRPISFYLHTKEQFDLLLEGTTPSEKKEYLSLRDETGNTALHFARDPQVVDMLTEADPKMPQAKNYTGYTPAEALSLAGEHYVNAKERVLTKLSPLEKEKTEQNISRYLAKRTTQISLKNAIDAIKDNADIDPADIALIKKEWNNFSYGTKAFLAKHAPQSFELSEKDRLSAYKIDGTEFIPPRGFEHEFLMPAETETAVSSINSILNRGLPKNIFTFGQDPEPSLLINNPNEKRVEVNSPIIENKDTLESWYMLNDLAKDLGATKNSTAGIHIHVGCKDKLKPSDIGIDVNVPNAPSAEEVQIAFLKTFLHVFTEARPKFDAVTKTGQRPDFADGLDTVINGHLDLASSPYDAYLKQVSTIKTFDDIQKFINDIRREKYVSVALPKDSKGTLEVRELKSINANKVGMNNDELHNIFKLVDEMTNISKEILTKNPPQKGKLYRPNVADLSSKIAEVGEAYALATLRLNPLPSSFTSPVSPMKRKELDTIGNIPPLPKKRPQYTSTLW